MNANLNKMKVFLPIITIITFTTCNAQNTSQNLNIKNGMLSTGENVSEIDKAISVIFQDKNNGYWFGSNGQGIYYEPKSLSKTVPKKLIHFSTKDGLCNNHIREIKEDKSGNIFFNTVGGISKFDGQKFTTLVVLDTSASENEWELQPDDLWFKGNQNENGVYRYDGELLHHLKFPKHHLADAYYARFPNNTWSPYEVYFIYEDSKKNMWFGTSNFGICRYDGKSLSWMYEEHLTNIKGGGSFGIRSIIEDNEGKFWFCNSQYRYTIYPAEKEKGLIDYKREKGFEGLKAANGGEFIYYLSIVEDNNHQLWMATYDEGVFKYNLSAQNGSEKIVHYPVKVGEKDLALSAIYKDNFGNLWLCTQDAGVYKFNGKTFEKFTS